jgi:hypothetical protein
MTKAAELAKMGEVLTNSQIGGRRNIVINGAMQISQRSTSETGLGATTGYHTVDRFVLNMGNTAGRLTMSQESITDLSGFAKAVKLDCTTADTSIASNERLIFVQRFEGQDLQQIKKGTSDAERVTVSFYVKGNANATYTLELADEDNSRFVAQEFSVTSSWTRVVKTFVADTTGKFDNDNAHSMSLNIWLHAGSDFTGGTFTSNTVHTTANQRVGDNQTSFYDSTDRTFFITGVQMEVGSVATPFEHASSFGEQLALCRRYYYHHVGGSGANKFACIGDFYTTAQCNAGISFPVAMRSAPSLVANSGSNYWLAYQKSAGFYSAGAWLIFGATTNATSCYNPHFSGATSGGSCRIMAYDASAYMAFDAEL